MNLDQHRLVAACKIQRLGFGSTCRPSPVWKVAFADDVALWQDLALSRQDLITEFQWQYVVHLSDVLKDPVAYDMGNGARAV